MPEMPVPGRPESVEDIDVYAPETIENWYPTYELLQQECPVYHVPGTNTYFLTRYEEIYHVLRLTDVFRRGAGTAKPLLNDAEAREYYAENGWPKLLPLAIDPPKHRRYRDMVDHFFSVAGAETQRDLIVGIVDELIDGFFAGPANLDSPAGLDRTVQHSQHCDDRLDPMGHASQREIEFVEAFAVPLPVRVITTMMGFDLADIPRLKRWSEAWVAPFSGQLGPEEEREVARLSVEFQHYINDRVAEKRANPTDDVISYLATTPVKLPDRTRLLRDGEIINIVDHLYIGGNETTTFALTSGLWLLIQHPEVQAELRSSIGRQPIGSSEKIRAWVDEVLRMESPTQGMDRHVVEDVELAGVPIPKGSHIHLRYAAANRDPAQFACPADIDLSRENGHRHLAFSIGETHCPGAALTRLEQRIATERLLARLDDLAFAEGKNDFHHDVNFTLRAFERLHVTVTENAATTAGESERNLSAGPSSVSGRS